MIKWPWRSNKRNPEFLKEFDVEETSYVISYTFKEPSRMKLTVHLPSMRVSEKHYDEFGNLIKYYHNSAMSTQHISNICKQDPNLQEYINDAKAVAKLKLKPKSRRTMYFVVGLIVWWIVLIILTICHSSITM